MADLLEDAARIVAEQAEDEGLWFVAKTAAEAYLQQELRRLHAAVELDPSAQYLAQIAVLPRYDRNKGRSNAGRHLTLNVPKALLAAIDELLEARAASEGSTGDAT